MVRAAGRRRRGVYRTAHGRGRNPVLLTAPVESVADVAAGISRAVFGTQRPAPRNLDGLADMLREAHVTRVIACDWQLSAVDTMRVLEVFSDNNVTLVR